MRRGVFLRLLLAFLPVIAVATLTFGFVVHSAWQRSLQAEIERSLLARAQLFAQQLQAGQGGQSLPRFVHDSAAAANARITVIDGSGKVLADSQADPDSMENHAARPRVPLPPCTARPA